MGTKSGSKCTVSVTNAPMSSLPSFIRNGSVNSGNDNNQQLSIDAAFNCLLSFIHAKENDSMANLGCAMGSSLNKFEDESANLATEKSSSSSKHHKEKRSDTNDKEKSNDKEENEKKTSKGNSDNVKECFEHAQH